MAEWQGNKRADDYLLTGVRLAEANELVKLDDIALRSADAKLLLRESNLQAEFEIQKQLQEAQRIARRHRNALRHCCDG